ncbi:DUF2267 domain-containing protein [Micromonospora sp. NPDC048830]|uniref:DUF2267 domain-containing protein n=1 Tax=Micromonospora sp. NPDC048830 TaxID=3364257 RepID=UPI003710430F
MLFPRFVDAVSRRAGITVAQAAAVTGAVLRTMAERVDGDPSGEDGRPLPERVGGHSSGEDGRPLPERVGGYLVDPAEPAGPAGAADDDFLARVGARAGVDAATARDGTEAVFATLRAAVTVQEFRQLVARMPRGETGAGGADPPPYDG